MKLEAFFAAHPRVAIAFSGGVDSAYLLYAAGKYARQVQAYYVQSAFQPCFEQQDAVRLAAEVKVSLTVIPLDILAQTQITANPPDRCYHCKRHIFSAILNRARADGFSVLLDGTNASDDAGDRPGMRALQELEVLSPLRLCGLTKAEIRTLSKEAGLFTWDKPAYACLATRIPTGRPIEERLLQRTEAAEGYLASLGFSDFRVRTMGETAKLQIPGNQFPLLLQNREKILQELKKTYESVCLDLEERHEQ